MRTLVRYGVVVVVSLLIGYGLGSAGQGSRDLAARPQQAGGEATGTEGSAPATAALSSPSPTPEEAEVLDGTWRLVACDLQLFTQGFDTSTLVGAVVVRNTGNVPAKVTVNLKWDALPGPLFDGGTKVVALEPGRSKQVRFTKKIGSDDVDRVQSSPGYQSADSGKLCKVKASIEKA
ncbi:MAG TPA: hypothetical protein VNO79_07700 [Actinomycetota bacterium]|nr:hypothetical protein [Actinomycetota bacterium]